MIQIFSAYLAYIFGKFACKICIQGMNNFILLLTLKWKNNLLFNLHWILFFFIGFSFAFPVNLTTPIAISLLMIACGLRNDNSNSNESDSCYFKNSMPDYLYWKCPSGELLDDFISREHAWIWLIWLLSQTWITLHIWTPQCERLASTEKLFVTPMYCSLLIDQSLSLNRYKCLYHLVFCSSHVNF